MSTAGKEAICVLPVHYLIVIGNVVAVLFLGF